MTEDVRGFVEALVPLAGVLVGGPEVRVEFAELHGLPSLSDVAVCGCGAEPDAERGDAEADDDGVGDATERFAEARVERYDEREVEAGGDDAGGGDESDVTRGFGACEARAECGERGEREDSDAERGEGAHETAVAGDGVRDGCDDAGDADGPEASPLRCGVRPPCTGTYRNTYQ